MHNVLLYNVWLIPLLPLLAALWITIGYVFNFNRGEEGEAQTAQTALIASSLSLLFVLALDVFAWLVAVPGQVKLQPWISSGDFQVFISFTLDRLGLVMATLVATISLLTIKFSVNYMHREAGFQRFFIIMCLFSSAMLLIVMAGNAVLTFIGWELAGLSSYLLIGYAFTRNTAIINADRVFITNRIGDAGFILGIAYAYIWLGDIEWNHLLQPDAGLSTMHIGVIAGGFLLAAIVKSALVPFSPWISRALEGPTPSSAIFYGSLMVHAGVYLVLRLEPLLLQDAALLTVLTVIGSLTFVYGFFTGLVQTDVKSSFMFSVIAHVGLMFVLCGLNQFELATWYLVLHAIYRAYQFLHAPSHMHDMSRPTRPASPLIQRVHWLYTASLQRFWLDHMADWLITNPVRDLARDAHRFEEKVVMRIVGLPTQITALASIDQNRIGKGHGMAGKLLQWLAYILSWFEEQLVLKGSGEGLMKVIQHLGNYVTHIEQLLSQPKYLMLLILITFVIIL